MAAIRPRSVELEDRQQWLEATVEWWAEALGLGHWRFEPIYGDKDHDAAARTWVADDYPHARIHVSGEAAHVGDERWSYWPDEESAVHELLHAVTRDVRNSVQGVIIPALPKDLRKPMCNLFDHYIEEVVEVLARTLVAVAHASRDGEPPDIGKVLVARDEGEAA